MDYNWEPFIVALRSYEETLDHEHYFSPKVDKYEGDVFGRFDAVLRWDGAFVYCVEADEWFKVDSYEEAKALAKECAEAW